MEKTARGWRADSDMVGERVIMYLALGEELEGVVTAEHSNGNIKVRDDEGTVWIGNQYDLI